MLEKSGLDELTRFCIPELILWSIASVWHSFCFKWKNKENRFFHSQTTQSRLVFRYRKHNTTGMVNCIAVD